MHAVNFLDRRRTARSREHGAVAIAVALSLSSLLVVSAMVLDFGLARLDRQQARLASDSAVMAGLRAADGGSDSVYTFQGVCGALVFLKANLSELGGLPSGICASPSTTAVCNPANPNDPASKAVYQGTVTSGGVTSTVVIKAPYLESDGNFPEESYPTLTSDPSLEQGCDQIGVIITQSRSPAFGSLATSGDLTFTVRSVGRVKSGAGDTAPALLLLERTDCSVLTVGSAGSPSRIKVYGSNGTAGSIHVDTDATGSGCGSNPNQQVFQGKQVNGIVAYGSPSPTGAAGMISSVAAALGVPPATVSDSSAYVYGTTSSDEFGAGPRYPVTGRRLVTRRPVDERYLGGVRATSLAAYSAWSSSSAGYSMSVSCSPNMAALAAMSPTQSLYVNCPGGAVLSGSIGAGKIYFRGYIKGGNLSMPNATEVYIDGKKPGSGEAVTIGNGESLCIRSAQCTTFSAGTCPSSATGVPSQARLVVRDGSLASVPGGLLRLCNTTVLLQGGDAGTGTGVNPGACLPASDGTAPTSTPCPGSPTAAKGTGQLNLGGATDWTAPNRYDDMTAVGLTPAQQQAARAGGEDLALWSESIGTASNPTFKMAGNGELHVNGVFMTPNAMPFTIAGGVAQDLTNAQFIARGFAVEGGATLTMRADASNAVPLPRLGPFLLVR